MVPKTSYEILSYYEISFFGKKKMGQSKSLAEDDIFLADGKIIKNKEGGSGGNVWNDPQSLLRLSLPNSLHHS